MRDIANYTLRRNCRNRLQKVLDRKVIKLLHNEFNNHNKMNNSDILLYCNIQNNQKKKKHSE